MAFLEKLDRCYYLETAIPKADIINALQEKIATAKKENAWFLLSQINYQNFIFWGDRLIIKYIPSVFGTCRSRGHIRITLKEWNNGTAISVKITPLGVMKEIFFWLNMIISIMFAAFAIWIIRGTDNLVMMIFILGVIWAIFFSQIVYSRYVQLSYLKKILKDLNIKDNLITTNQTYEVFKTS